MKTICTVMGVACFVSLCGCATQQSYETLRMNGRAACVNMLPSERERCERRVEDSYGGYRNYDEYLKARAAEKSSASGGK